MSKTCVYEGEVLALAAPYAVSSGDGLQVGQIIGIATNDAENAATVEVAICGVFDVTKEASSTFSAGALVYWDNVNKCMTPTAAIVGQGNTKAGVAVADAGASAATVRIRLSARFVASEAALPGG